MGRRSRTVLSVADALELPPALVNYLCREQGIDIQGHYLSPLTAAQQTRLARAYCAALEEGRSHEELVDTAELSEARLAVLDSVPKVWLQKRVTPQQAEAAHMVSSPKLGPRPVPFGFAHYMWRAVREMMIDGDELWDYRSSPESWANLAGRAGIALVRQGRVIACFTTCLN
jgi:hypothetical protein